MAAGRRALPPRAPPRRKRRNWLFAGFARRCAVLAPRRGLPARSVGRAEPWRLHGAPYRSSPRVTTGAQFRWEEPNSMSTSASGESGPNGAVGGLDDTGVPGAGECGAGKAYCKRFRRLAAKGDYTGLAFVEEDRERPMATVLAFIERKGFGDKPVAIAVKQSSEGSCTGCTPWYSRSGYAFSSLTTGGQHVRAATGQQSAPQRLQPARGGVWKVEPGTPGSTRRRAGGSRHTHKRERRCG